MLSLFILTACNTSNENAESNDPDIITSITLAPHLTELVYSAGGGKNLLGVSAYSNYPPDALDKQIIGDAFHLNIELITQLNPDVIFYWHNGTPAQTIEQLQSMGFQLENIDITYLADIPRAIHQIAQTLHTQAVTATDDFMATITRLKAQHITGQSALIQISNQPIYTVSGAHWMSEAVGVCGLHNVFRDLASLSAAVTLESVVLKKPDVIVRTEPLREEHQLSQWPSIPAIAKQQIAVLEADHFTRPTLRTLSAIESLCQQVDNF